MSLELIELGLNGNATKDATKNATKTEKKVAIEITAKTKRTNDSFRILGPETVNSLPLIDDHVCS